MNDWLGNELNVGDAVLHTSKSSLTGMNLGEITAVNSQHIKIRIWRITERFRGTTYLPDKIITLQSYTSAYKSVTRYFGKLPNKE